MRCLLGNGENKLCFFAPNLTGGGAERIISILANHFSKNGFEVDLVLASATGPYLKNIDKSVNIIDLNSKRVSLAILKLSYYLRMNQPDIVFSSQMHASRALILAAKLAGVNSKVIIRQPTMLISPLEKNSFFKNLNLKVFLLLARSVDKVIVTSQAMANEFIELSKISNSKVQVVYNPLPISHIQEMSQEPLEHPWFEHGQTSVILAVGRLEKVKNFTSLIKAFGVVAKNLDARLLILGEGAERQKLENLIVELGLGERVQMPGFVGNPYKYMKHAKVYVQSSIREGFSNGLIEAMACNTQIVATDCVGGTSEILEGGKWGKLVPVNDVQAMASGLMEILNTTSTEHTLTRTLEFDVNSFVVQLEKILV